ncbi:MAG: tetratricopeptide repeat protein [Leptolyngbyaceae cyanobacterium]
MWAVLASWAGSIRRQLQRTAIALLTILLLGLMAWPPPIARAQSISSPTVINTADLTPQERQELEDLRTEKRFKRFIDDRISNSPQIQDRIEVEVDRVFDGTATLLNIVLAILTLIPLLAALGVWLLRRSVVSELVSEVRVQLEKEVFTQLKQQKLDAIAEIEDLKKTSLQQVQAMVLEAQAVLNELKTQTRIANKEIELLKSQTATQLETMVSDAQQIKDQTIQELTKLLPLSMTEQLPPEAQPRLGNLTALLESLKNAIPQVNFSATDYLKQGNAFFFESRYDDAAESYDRAIQLSPELYEAWFTKASMLMLLQRYDEAASAYQFATQLKPDSYEAWAGQGTALTRAQQFEAAIAALDEAIALRPEDHLALFNRGNAQAGLEKWNAALADYNATLERKPDFAKAQFQKGQILQQRGDWASAIAAYDAILQLNNNGKEVAEVWYSKAICHALQGDVEPALTALEGAVAGAPAFKAQAQADPIFEDIRHTLRFQALIDEAGSDA